MPETATYVEFDVSELPLGYVREETRDVIGFEPQRVGREPKPLTFRGRVAENVEEGNLYGNLFKEGSLTLGEEAALFNLYLLDKRGLVELTEPQRAYLNHKFGRIRYGNILETVVDFDRGDRSMPAKKATEGSCS